MEEKKWISEKNWQSQDRDIKVSYKFFYILVT